MKVYWWNASESGWSIAYPWKAVGALVALLSKSHAVLIEMEA